MVDWDRSHEYVLHKIFVDHARLTIQFTQSPPSIRELAAVRKVLPQFRHTAPGKVKLQLGTSPLLELGEMPTPEAIRIANAARNAGLDVRVENTSFVSYAVYDITIGCAVIIEDDQESAAIVQSMLDAGVPVKLVEG